MTKPDWIPTNTRPYVALIGKLFESVNSDELLVVLRPSELSYVAETGTEDLLRLLDVTLDLSWLIGFLEAAGVSEPQRVLDSAADQLRIVLLGHSQEKDIESLRGIGIQFESEIASLARFEEDASFESDSASSFMVANEIAELILSWDSNLDIPSMTARFADLNALPTDFIRCEFFKVLPELLLHDYTSLYLMEDWRRSES